MSNATVTPSMRAVAWNVHFTIGEDEDPGAFAGIYQVPGSDLVTFRNVCDELRLCFEYPYDIPDNENEKAWNEIAFSLNQDNSPSSLDPDLSFVTEAKMDQAVPSLAPLRPKEQNVLSYHIYYHKNCTLPPGSPLESHMQAKCAKHLPNPSRRRDPRYLPPNKTPSDPKLSVMPLRKKLKARSVSPSKRSASGSTSPTKEVDDEFENVVAPASLEIDLDEARKVTNEFRSSCLNRATSCAVSGEGESWCPGPPIGPGIQACHIIPQHHYHVYPVAGGDADDDVPFEASNRRLKEAWQSTWSPRNGILLMKHLHDFFDARLFSIHPRTLRIRVFVPYNALTRFNGQRASLPNTIDRKALRHHYEMSCIENMAAERPILEIISPTASRMTSGLATPLTAKTDLPATPTSGDPGNGRSGDPTKRSRPSYPDQNQQRDSSTPGDSLHTLHIADLVVERGQKRKGLGDDDACSLDMWLEHDNREEFLKDVDWELRKLKKRRQQIG
ncbi:uncharacterized protein FMAN_15347 [Fusarium mangiferae]|uniref:HNH nuclease domain-containing protein n=1 Tax=Fusarium mangiferae TaxID=192010 RepID=A0A1L7U949_FUSMA|nr:uncharacterized protein FMAN_15347 [Fusarium mangiferae]CVL07240.1 uncharacterized protein FMAN_15347 [Fusarium mangiferae]